MRSLYLASFLLLFVGVARCDEEQVNDEPKGDVDPVDIPLPDDMDNTEDMYAKWRDEGSDVVVLTGDNADEFLDNTELAILEFYAPWCGHCTAFAPEYEKIATELRDADIPVAKIDADEHKDLGSRFDVSGFPTIKIWKSGQAIEYKGGRTQFELVQKVMQMNDPDWEPPKKTVVELTEDNFNEVVLDADFALVMFHAPWCGHCKKMKPDFEQAADDLASKGSEAVIGMLDATVHKDIASRYEVTGYPTLKYFKKGRNFEYKGERSAHEIVAEVEKLSGEASSPFDSPGEAKKLVYKTRVQATLVGCFENDESEALQEFKDNFNNVREEWIRIKHTTDAAVKKAIECKDGDVFLVHDFNFRCKTKQRIPIASAEELEENKTPLVGQFLESTSKDLYMDWGKPHVYIIGHIDFNPQYRSASNLIRDQVVKVAKKNKDKYIFALLNEDDFPKEMTKWGLHDTSEDINIVIINQAQHIFPYEPEDSFSAGLLTDVLQMYENGEMERQLKSAKPLSKKNNSGPVKVVSAVEFEKVVKDKKKDVLIEFYAPWCGHCKKLEPILKKLGKAVDSQKDLVIAKFDAIANDVPDDAFEVKGFPTIYYVNKENEVEMFEGDRTVAGFTKFLLNKRNPDIKFKSDEGSKDEL